MPWSVVVIGAGAIGGILAARLAAAGHVVTVVDANAAHVAAVRAGGLTVTGPEGVVRAAVAATGRLRAVAPADLVVIATKARDVGTAVADAVASRVVGDRTVVLTIQNGIGSAEVAAAAAPAARVVGATVGRFGSRVEAPGHVVHDGAGVIGVGPPTTLQEPLRALFAGAGFAVRCYASREQLVWEKLVCNAGVSGPCAAYGVSIGELRADPAAWRRARGCATEAYDVGRRLGVAFAYPDPVAHLEAFADAIGPARPSMLQDVEAGRPSEIDAINGGVVAAGRDLGVPTPFNDAVAREVRARERGAPPRPLGT